MQGQGILLPRHQQLQTHHYKHAGFVCGRHAENYGNTSDLAFSDPATGVKVGKIQLTAGNNSFVLKELQLRTGPSGCKADEG